MHSKFGLSFVCDGKGMGLGQAGLLGRNIAPLLDNRLLDRSGVGPWPGADLLGDINALLSGLKLGNQLGHMLAGPLGLQGTLLLGGVLHNGLDFVVTFLSALLEATSCRGTELPWLLGTAGDRGVLLHLLLGHAADLPGPLGALGVGGVSRGLILTLLLHLSGALDDVVLHVMDLLLGPALGFVLSPADLLSLDITILDKRGPADISGLVEGNLLVLDETVLPEVLFTLLLLLGLVLGDVGGVAPPVVGVVALDLIVVLDLRNHLDLVDTPLAVRTRTSSSNGREAHIGVISLTLGTCPEALNCLATMVLSMVTMVACVMGSVVLALLGVEGECAEKVPALPGAVPAQLASSQGTAREKAQSKCQLRGNHIDGLKSLQVLTRALLNRFLLS